MQNALQMVKQSWVHQCFTTLTMKATKYTTCIYAPHQCCNCFKIDTDAFQ